MNRLAFVFLSFVFVFGCATHQTATKDDTSAKAKKIVLEFRFAGQNPDTGLIQKTVKGSYESVYLKEEVLFSNSDVENAYVVDIHGKPAVGLSFNKKSAKRFYDITKSNIHKSIAILLDNVVVSVVQIRMPIPGGKSVIIGEFSKEEAKQIARGIL